VYSYTGKKTECWGLRYWDFLIFKIENKLENWKRKLLWFRGNTIKKKYYLVVWKQVCNSMAQGGFEISNIKNMNKTLLCKWI
jgi:hypothetical protein